MSKNFDMVFLAGLLIGMLVGICKRKLRGVKEQEKFSDVKMKQFDSENNDEIIQKYVNKQCTIDILEPLANVEDRKIQLLLKEINNTTLLFALAEGFSFEIKSVLYNLS